MDIEKANKMLADFEDGADNGFDRKNTTFTMRMAPSQKMQIWHEANKAGLSMSEYMEILIGEIHVNREAKKQLKSAVGTCENLTKENTMLKERVAKLEGIEAKYNFIRQQYSPLFEKAQKIKYQQFKGKKVDTFEDFMSALSKSVQH